MILGRENKYRMLKRERLPVKKNIHKGSLGTQPSTPCPLMLPGYPAFHSCPLMLEDFVSISSPALGEREMRHIYTKTL